MILNKTISLPYIFNQIKYDIFIVLLVGLTTNIISFRYIHLLPDMPLTIPSFLGTAISILLSFKMNQSYDRWWEARKVWGAIVNDSRSLVIQLQSFLGFTGLEDVKTIAYRQMAWCYALGRSLRGQNPLEDAEQFISKPELNVISAHNNKPLAILQLNAKDIRALRERGKIDTFTQLQLDDTLTRLTDSMGKAERINGTIFPSTYRQFLYFTIYLFVVTLAISLKDVSMIFEIPLLLLISTSFFLIQKSASQLQDPFRNRPSDVSVTAIARTIEINIRQLLGETNVPEPLKPIGFYIL
ncbi:bestrophin family protein [Adhaeribacter aquaticus]|uniref:bestrophin family protein n=1 Tax=Adhaeribacter aquaticus TaxID=299567 RepID=UPI0003F79D9D|nr:bestrophin family ion channel [Adhaeribacter aquaticus]